MRAFVFLLAAIAAGAVNAETLSGRIEDPGLRRKTALVYVDAAPGKFARLTTSRRLPMAW